MISLRLPSWNISTILCVLVLLIPTISGDCTFNCTCDATSKDPKSNTALHYKVGAIAAILVSSVLGVSFPVLGRTIPALKPENDFFFIIKAFAAGVILATGFIHILPDAFENLSSPCLGQVWGKYPFTGFFAMLSAILTLMVDGYASSYYRKSHQNKQANKGEERGDEQAGHIPVHTHATHGHAHGSVSPAHGDLALPDLIRHRVIAQVLELGIVFHSVIIGVDLGVSQSVGDIKSLLIALCFHQFFEGIGLGGCITQAKFKSMSAAIMAAFFSLTTPLGVAIGIGISSTYNENSSTALIVEGTLNALAAGILIYMSLVDLLAQDFMNPRLQANMKLQLGANGSMLLGAGCMALLAYWA